MYTIYSTPTCTFCVQAKDLLASKGLEFETVDITLDADALAKMKEIGARTVPQVFLGEEHIGGFLELRAKLSQGLS